MPVGTVKWFDDAKGYGFISMEDTGADAYVHRTSIRATGARALDAGQRVECDIGVGTKGPVATNVRPLPTKPHAPPTLPQMEKAHQEPSAPVIPKSTNTGRATTTRTSIPPLPPLDMMTPHKTLAPQSKRVSPAVALGTAFGVAGGKSVFAIGAQLREVPAFADAVREMLLPAQEADTAASQLASTIAAVLKTQGASAEPELTRELRVLIPGLIEPVAKLVISNLPAERYAASCARLELEVRSLVGTGNPNWEGLKKPSPSLEQEVTYTRPAGPDSAVASKSGTSLLRQLERHVRNQAAPEFERARRAAETFRVAVDAWLLAPLGFEEAGVLAVAHHELTETLKPVVDYLVPTTEAQGRAALLKEAEQLVGAQFQIALPTPVLEALSEPTTTKLTLRAMKAITALEGLRLPEWFWGATQLPRQASLGIQVAHLLDAPALLDSLDACAAWAGALTAEQQQLLSTCQPQAVEGSIFTRLQRALDATVRQSLERDRRQRRIAALSEYLDPSLIDSLTSSQDEASDRRLGHAEECVAKLVVVRPGLHPDIYVSLLDNFRRLPDGIEHELTTLEAAITSLGAEVARAISQRSVLLNVADRLAGTALHKAPSPSSQAPKAFARLDHPLSRGSGGGASTYAADLVWAQVPGQNYGRIVFPVRVTFLEKGTGSREFRVDVTGDLLANIPPDWFEEPLSRSLQIPAGADYLDVAVTVPVPVGRAELLEKENRNIDLRFTLRHAEDRVEGRLSWQGVRCRMPEYAPPFPTTVDPALMRANPLGVEKRFQELLSLVKMGERSFFVAGPRRFGKTTLVNVLVEQARSLGDVLVLRSVVASAKPDVASIWEDIAKQLRDSLKRPVDSTLVDGLLPADTAFDDVRTEAAARQIRSIYILIDEAQALFTASGRPYELSEAIKQRLENSWGQRSNGRAAIRLGLIGQAHLPELMGSNLIGAIPQDFVEDRIRPEDLLPILRNPSTGGALQSSAEARTRLAALAGNLWILDKLLSAVWQDCQSRGRSWFVEEDVEQAAQSLVEADRSGTNDTLWSYVRDVLNDSDDLKIWKPSETYPLAMAVAHLRSRGAAKEPVSADATIGVLEKWATGVTLLRERVDDALQQLHRQKVLRRDGAFQVPMLERLLAVRAELPKPLSDDAEREVTARLGLRRVKRPEPWEKETEQAGGQARVYRGRFRNSAVAVRCVQLNTSKAHERFLREVRLLERLEEVSSELAPQARTFLPRVRASGLDEAEPSVGLVLYDWVAGTPLEEKSLSEMASVFIASCLAETLRFLDQASVIHRDIQPRNILIRKETGEPVLIDFGLSQSVDDVGRSSNSLTGVATFLPPEVLKHGAQRWTVKGDIYSLGATLERCLNQEETSDQRLRSLIKRMCDAATERRPNAAELTQELRGLADSLQLNQRRDAVLKRFDGVIALIPATARAVAQSSRGDFWASKVGTISSKEARMGTVATFLENLLQTHVRSAHATFVQRIGDGGRGTFLVRLGELKSASDLPRELRSLATSQAMAVGKLRNADAHPAEAERLLLEAIRELGATRPTPASIAAYRGQLETAVRTIGNSISTLLKAPAVNQLVNDWLKPGID